MKSFFAVVLCLLALGGCVNSPSPEESFSEKIKPTIDTVVDSVRENAPLSDLSCSVRIDEVESEKSADGELVFVSDELESFSPEEQYAITQEVSRMVFLRLTGGKESLQNIKVGDFRLTLSHGIGYSLWQNSEGTEFESSYYDLKKDGTEIYDNPTNDLEAELEKALGMPYDEWLKSQNTEDYEIVSSSEDDYWPAVTAAQNVVKDELKAPSTARFPVAAENYSVARRGSEWKVSGFVDAQNGFGATVREYWTSAFRMGDTDGDSYSVSNYSVTFGQN